ncbi:WOX homeodomain transcription factor [Hordeum vulgare]|nr:WOX homeodomain transcription factor [Hordeum vulgare]
MHPVAKHTEDWSSLAMESVEHQAAGRLSRSPPHPAAPLSPDSAAAAAGNARWTPTKEQIGVLEGLYRQGLRNPTTEQIEQVAARLQKHGPVEGKNVFYWFQNHTARHRQRQKQQAFDYFSKQFRRPQPLPVLHRAAAHPSLPPVPLHAPPPDDHAPPACNGQAMYRQQPCYVTAAAAATQAAANAQAQAQTPLLYPRAETVAHDKVPTPAPAPAPATVYYQGAAANNASTQQSRALQFPPAAGTRGPSDARPRRPETLNLFPLHPTFAIPEKTRAGGIAGSVTLSPAAPSASGSGAFSWEPESASGDASLPLYDFFGVGR